MADPGTPDPKREQDIDWAWVRTRIRERLSHRLGREDPALDDLTHQAAIELLRVVRRDGATSLEGLIAAVALGTAVDEIRRRQRERNGKARWEAELANLERQGYPDFRDGSPDTGLLWFLLLQYLRTHDPPAHRLGVAYAELGSWPRVADSIGQNPDATRQQWSRSVRRFLKSLRRDPGPFEDWLDDV